MNTVIKEKVRKPLDKLNNPMLSSGGGAQTNYFRGYTLYLA